MIIKHMEKKLYGNYARILCAVLNKSWKRQPTKQQLYGHLPPIKETIQVKKKSKTAGEVKMNS